MPFVPVLKVSELPPGSLTEVSVGGKLYAVCNSEGTVRALGGECLHQGGPLGQGNLADGRIICPWHAWEFDCVTGASSFGPDHCVPTFEVKVEGDQILLQVP